MKPPVDPKRSPSVEAWSKKWEKWVEESLERSPREGWRDAFLWLLLLGAWATFVILLAIR